MTPKKTEIAVDVADLQAENASHRLPIRGTDPDAVPGICAFDFITIHEVDCRLHLGQQIVHFPHVILAVAIGIEDEVFSGVREPGNQRSAVSQISFMVDDTKKREFGRKPIKRFSSFVLASVVDNQHFEIVRHLPHFISGGADYVFDRVLIVVRREERGK
jgi:hypothetical protein